jgi:HK97 gp10 family phage protein
MARNVFELSVRNQAALVANFYSFDVEAKEQIRALVVRQAESLRNLTMSFAPVDTGYMRDHVLARYGPEGFSFEVGWEASDFLGAGLSFYPFFVEYGTRFMPAQPSLGPAWREVEPRYTNALRYLLQQLAYDHSARGGGR